MGELFRMWSNTRMVVLTAITAALYAAILIPFKVVPLIPGITEFRPANAVPVVCSFLFGPAAAWGSAFGNLIGDFFGGLGPGDVFGFVGNLLYGLVPYHVWRAIGGGAPVPVSGGGRRAGAVAAGVTIVAGVVAWRAGGLAFWKTVGAAAVAGTALVLVPGASLRLVLVIALASTLCATVVGWGLNLLGFYPFYVLGTIVLLNDLVVSVVLAPALLAVLHPRLRRAGLLYADVMGVRPAPPRWRVAAGLTLAVAGTLGAFVAGQAITAQGWVPPWVPWRSAGGSVEVGLGLLPLLGVAVLGLALL
jgi:energy-coupling factor transport system substrate-specific component